MPQQEVHVQHHFGTSGSVVPLRSGGLIVKAKAIYFLAHTDF